MEAKFTRLFPSFAKVPAPSDGDTRAFDCSADSKAQRAPDFKSIFLPATLQYSDAIGRALNFSIRHTGLMSQLLVPTGAASQDEASVSHLK